MQSIRDSRSSLDIMKTLSLFALAALSVPSVVAISGKATTTVWLPLFSLPGCQTNRSIALLRWPKRRLWMRSREREYRIQLAGSSLPFLLPPPPLPQNPLPNPPLARHLQRRLHSSRLPSPLQHLQPLLVRFRLRNLLPTDFNRHLPRWSRR